MFFLSWAAPRVLYANWSIGIYQGDSPLGLSPISGVRNPVLTAADVTDVLAEFVADPFMINVGGNWYMFFEVLNGETGQGDIGYATSDDGVDWNYQEIVLDEPHHLSYPHVFEWENEYYMIPEAHATNSVKLYKANSFPLGWSYVATLITGNASIDPSIFRYNQTWWMFVGTTSNDTLQLFYADDLTGPWSEHPSSPLITGDPNIARPGGRVVSFNGRLLRIAQDDFPGYGNQVRVFEITELDKLNYRETEVSESPVLGATGYGWNRDGMHQLDAWLTDTGSWLAVVDGIGDSTVAIDGGIPKTEWALWYADSEELRGEDGAAVNAFDGDASTIWHTQWLGGSPAPPHTIEIYLGGVYSINGFIYIPRQDDGVNGRIADYEFYVSVDGVDWGLPVASGAFVNDAEAKEVQFLPVEGQYIRLRSLSEVNDNPWTTVAELNVLGTEGTISGNMAPNGIIDTPSADVTIHVGEWVEFLGTGSDINSDFPLSYQWNFDAGTGEPETIQEEDPGLVQFDAPGTYTVALTVTDPGGLSDPTPARRVITVVDPNAPGPIPQTEWALWYVDSEELRGEDGAAVNAFDGDASTIWHTQWLGGSPAPPHTIEIYLGGVYSINGFIYIPRQDDGVNGRIADYEFYVSVDGVDWGVPVASGAFVNDAEAKEVQFLPVEGQYIRLRSLSEVTDNPWASVAEIQVLGQ